MNQSLQNWIEANLLQTVELNEKVIQIDEVGKFLIVEPKTINVNGEIRKDVLFDNDFQILLNDLENNYTSEVDYLLFQFGNNWYYSNDLVPEEILPFLYLGKPKLDFTEKLPFLGVHTGYELCNASLSAKDWIRKAKFLGVDTLGICEENTLAGTLPFQEECKKAGIKSIIGETIVVLAEDKSKFTIKLYVQNAEGWKNLLWINKLINVDNGGEYIKWEELFHAYKNGLVMVLTPEFPLAKYKGVFNFQCYFQIDFVEWGSSAKDEQWLKSIQYYLDNWFNQSDLKPILIPDAYYLNKEDHVIKKVLNNIGKVGFKSSSKDQYFKTLDDIYNQAITLFKDDDVRLVELMDAAIENANQLSQSVDFKIPTGINKFPEYEMNEEEKALYSDNEELFMALVVEGLERKIIDKGINPAKYFDRIEKEIDVIKFGSLIDYFLILHDIIRWCKTQDILVGIGRGSSAGSLINFLLHITQIDPLQYNLLFERFLNRSRVLVSKADIDTDFESSRRDDVKRYIESKYGVDYVAAIGTYSTFRIRGAVKDLSRDKGIDYSKTNYITSLLPKLEDVSFTDLFKKYATTNNDFKTFIQKHNSIFELIPLCLNQPKTSSVHPSGVIIVPKKYGTIYEQMPVKSIDGLLVSEWEGDMVDASGFLKADVLGVKQLDKLASIMRLIKQNRHESVTFDDVVLNEEPVMNLFKEGLCDDVFQFGTPGLKAFCKELKPDNVNDLITAVALYRPGVMESGMHKKYVKIKHGREQAEYDEGCEEITKSTHGQLVFQEQIMEVFVKVGGFDLVDSDSARAAMGKKKLELLLPYKQRFIDNAVTSGYDKERVIELWDKMEAFAKYAFNASHAASYAITGYFCQWFKYNYPLEFWTVSLQYAEEKDIINRISEITKTSSIQVASVDINFSTRTFFAEKDTIYWAITSVKWVGEKAVEAILKEREANGQFFSIEDFVERTTDTPVNKRCVTNLILAGAFDKIERISPQERAKLLQRYVKFAGISLNEEVAEGMNVRWTKEYQWTMRQKELTGYGFIDYRKIVQSSHIFASQQKRFKENGEILFMNAEDEETVVVSGILQNIIERNSKKGKFGQLELVDNTDVLYVTFWNDIYEPNRALLNESIGSIIILSGKVVYDTYKNNNVVQSKSQTKIEII